MASIKILAIGDTVGKPGRTACRRIIPKLREQRDIDFVVANGENIAGGSSVTHETVDELFSAGVDVITSGDHIFRKKEAIEVLQGNPMVLRPLNYPNGAPGHGYAVKSTKSGVQVAVVNLLGRVFMPIVDCPFETVNQLLRTLRLKTKIVLVDLHCEATSEKVAMGWFLDGQVSAVFGTHTHIQTADEHVLPQGTAYITDLGMTGPYHSVLGRDIHQVLHKFRSQLPGPMEVTSGDARLSGALIEIDTDSGHARSIERVHECLND